MSLFKLAVYGAIGYVVYQIFFVENPKPSTGGGGSGPRRQEVQRGQGGNTGMTGAGRGRIETVQGADGGRSTHTVGRGVIS